jgi:hypothetical protein
LIAPRDCYGMLPQLDLVPPPEKYMSVRTQTRIAILLAGLVLAAMPARGQVVSVLDDQGHRMYINLAPPPVKAANPSATGAVSPKDTSDAVRTNRAGFVVRNAPVDPDAPRPISRDRLETLIQTIADRHHVDAALVRAVMQVESGGNPTAVSRKGAMGLMQLMPDTALQMGVTRVFDPQENLEAGVRTLRALLVRYNGDLDKALAAYNAGTGAVDRAGGVPRNRETRDYVRKVTNNYFQSDAGQPAAAPSTAQRTAAGNTTSPGNAPSTTNTKSPTKTTSSASTTSSENTTPLANAPSHGNTTPPAPPHHIHQERDSQGRLVWVND